MQNETDIRASEPGSIRVAIIEDLREGLAVLINGTPGFKCAGNYRTMEDAIYVLEKEPPDVLLTDLGLPLMSGTEGIRILKEHHPQLPRLSITMKRIFSRLFVHGLQVTCLRILRRHGCWNPLEKC